VTQRHDKDIASPWVTPPGEEAGMPRYSKKQKVALDALMKEDVHRCALEIIAQEGLQGLTLDRLAGRVGVSRATLYNYFADRDAIVDFIEERTVAPVLAAMERIVEREDSARAKLEAIAQAIFSAVRDNVTFVVSLSPERFSRRMRSGQRQRRERGLELLRQVFRQGIDSREFRALPVDLVSEVFHSTITGLIDNMALRGEFHQPRTLVPILMTVFLRGVQSADGVAR
jgi:AcrR family transcriptional regulator